MKFTEFCLVSQKAPFFNIVFKLCKLLHFNMEMTL